MNRTLVDEVLLITGSSGIAAAVARMWAAEAPVFVFGVNENECRALAEELERRLLQLETCATKSRCEVVSPSASTGSGKLTRS